MPLTRQQKKELNIIDLQSYTMTTDDSLDAMLKAFEARMEDRFQELLREIRRSQSESLNKTQHGESSKGSRSEKYDHGQDIGYTRMRVEFPRWEDGNLIGWISHAERFFHFHRTPEESKMEIASIQLKGDAIQWYDWYEHTHEEPSWEQFKSGLLIHFGPSEHENIDGQLAKIRQTSTGPTICPGTLLGSPISSKTRYAGMVLLIGPYRCIDILSVPVRDPYRAVCTVRTARY
ncbi:hypothetical protein B296_00055096 [Ensete ventricosum]|uniref:Retrotransposon gag domain-containing protein n=1 Tax=Ensete ventricosum TaxID=4639 RepID=A0A426WY53_ENSVE|nr:hypothetical protein B296_00055096 [Ensete ventricosum]